MATLEQAFKLDTFKSKLATQGVARAYLFYITIKLPEGLGTNSDAFTYTAQSASLPGRTVNTLSQNLQGYVYSIGGNSTWSDWKLSFIMDGDAIGYRLMKAWFNKIHNPGTGKIGNPKDYIIESGISVTQIHHSGQKELNSFYLMEAWPKDMSEVSLKYGDISSATYDVTFAYQYALDRAPTSGTTT